MTSVLRPAGAVAPDLPYLLPQATSADLGPYSDFNLTYTHEFGTGLISGTVVALLLLVTYHQLLKRPPLALLPETGAARLIEVADRFHWRPAGRLAWIIVSAAIGVLTHLIWDALVHENGSASWSPLPNSPAVTEALWWVSSLAGVLGIAAWLRSRSRRTPGRPIPSGAVLSLAGRLRALTVLTAAGLIGVILKMVGHGIGPAETAGSLAALRQVVAGGMSGVAVGALIYAVLWTIRPSRASGRD